MQVEISEYVESCISEYNAYAHIKAENFPGDKRLFMLNICAIIAEHVIRSYNAQVEIEAQNTPQSREV